MSLSRWFAWPTQCEVCHCWNARRLCDPCVARFAPPVVSRCARCGLRLGLAAAACGACLRAPPAFTRTVCAADYAFPWDRLVGAFKFRDQVELADALAARIADAVRAAAVRLPDCAVPVPLAPERLAERGYNQAWELARRVGRSLGVPALEGVLLRPVHTAHQADLTRAERQRNLRTAFLVDPARRRAVDGRRIAVVDDVMTTGATADEAARQLLRAGAAEVQVWVLARTPDA